jgi:hypothetical protein
LSNYDYLPKYNFYKGTYNGDGITHNIYEMTGENTNINLLSANRLCQHIFHWRSIATNNIFNLSSSFSPFYDNPNGLSMPGSDLIANNMPNITSKEYSLQDNPLEIFKFTNAVDDSNDWFTLVSLINNDDSYYSIDTSKIGLYKTQQFGNMVVDNNKLNKYLIQDLISDKPRFFKVGIMLINEFITRNTINTYLKNDWHIYNLIGNGFVLFNKQSQNTTQKTSQTWKVLFMMQNIENIDFLYFKGLIERDLLNEDPNNKNSILDASELNNLNNDIEKYYKVLQSILKSFIPYTRIKLNGALYPYKADSPNPASTETVLKRNNRTVDILRISTNLVPFFITHADAQNNKVYWIKQYKDTIPVEKTDSNSDPDDIYTYTTYVSSGYPPVYPSIGFCPLNSSNINYEKFYIDASDKAYNYKLERSWYKNNQMLFLPIEFDITETIKTGTPVKDKDIITYIKRYFKKRKSDLLDQVIKYYINDLYNYTYTYDYKSNTNISEQKIKIHFKLK